MDDDRHPVVIILFNPNVMNDLTIDNRPRSGGNLFTIHSAWLIAAFAVIYIFAAWWIQTGVLTDEVYYNTLAGKTSTDKIDSLIQLQHRMGLIGYILVPFELLVRVAAASFCLLTGLYLTGRKLSPRAVFKIALFAESAFIGYALLKLIVLAFFHPISRLQELQAFAPLSLYSIADASSIPDWLVYPLQTINLFEITYWIFLAAGLRHLLGEPLGKMLLLVLGSYGLGLLCWLTAAIFLILNASQ